MGTDVTLYNLRNTYSQCLLRILKIRPYIEGKSVNRKFRIPRVKLIVVS